MPASSNSVAAACHGGSTSIVSVEAPTGRHVFKIDGYSAKIKRRLSPAPSTHLSSSDFSVGGHTWFLAWHPSGCVCTNRHKDRADRSSIFLERRGSFADGADVKAMFEFSLLDKDGAPVPVPLHNSQSERGLTIFLNAAWGFCGFIRREVLESSYIRDDSFTIWCEVTVLGAVSEASVMPRPDLHRHLGDLLESGVGGDVTFEVGSQAFVAHRYVLAARSPVFKEEFFSGGPMKEETTTPAARVQVDGMEARVFKAMLRFIYTDSLPEIAEGDKVAMARHLIVAADRYSTERLRWICEDMLCTFVDKRIAASTLVLAEQHGCQRLKEACLKCLKSPDNSKTAGPA